MYKSKEDFKATLKSWINDQIEDDGISEVAFDSIYSLGYSDDGTTVREVASTGGEDEGSNLTVTYEIKNGEWVLYVKFSGWYQSFVGGEYEDWDFVEPKTKEVVVYE